VLGEISLGALIIGSGISVLLAGAVLLARIRTA
jgi:hypothetical protein